jgi:carboxylate-amine ligase
MSGPRTAARANPSAAELREIFDHPAPFTVGVEEELMLLDPATLDLAPRAPELLARLGGDPRYKLEMPAAQIEIASPPLADAAEAETFLAAARADLAQAAGGLVRLGAAGVHPFAAAEGELNDSERYRNTLERFGRVARRQLVFGLQVHVCVRGADRALAVYNGLRNLLPELLALAANAPLYGDEDSGLATVRPKICELLPRQGVPPALASWEEFASHLAWGEAVGSVPEPRVWWWELRPHAAYGTLELRVPDAQLTVADAAAVTAVVHALAAHLGRAHDDGEPAAAADTWRIAENRWQALSGGTKALLADLETGEVRPARERLHELLDDVAADAAALGTSAQLERARALIDAGGGAARLRAAAKRGGGAAAARLIADSFLA